MVMLEPSREDWALLVSIAVFKKLRISLIIRIICEICEICVRKRRLRIIRMPKASREIAFEQCSSKRAACQWSRHGAVWHKKLRERSGNFTKKSA